MKKKPHPLPTGRQATPLLKAEGSNKNLQLNDKKASWFFVPLCLRGIKQFVNSWLTTIKNKKVKIRNKEVAVSFEKLNFRFSNLCANS